MSSDSTGTGVPNLSPFQAIRREDEDGNEYWSARELAKILGYTEYGKFKHAIQKAEGACEHSSQAISDHIAHVSDMIGVGKGARRKVEDIHLTRYACYLIVQNADPSKPIVALGQSYFRWHASRRFTNAFRKYSTTAKEGAKAA